MRVTGVVRESGRGVLGRPGYPTYEVRVVDTTTMLTARRDDGHGHGDGDGDGERVSVRHEVLWWPVTDPELPLGQRPVAKRFAHAAERAAFLAASVRPQVALTPVDDGPGQRFDRPHPLAEVVGDWLAGVTFSVGSVQLDLQPSGATPAPAHRTPLTFQVPPLLHRDGRTMGDDDAGWADGIVALLGREVTEADEYLDVGLYIGFDEVGLSVAIDAGDGYEVATFGTPGGVHVWVPD
jgi:hypothetical protein